MNSDNPSLLLPRRRVIASGARFLGALSLAPVAGLLADGCARQPSGAGTLNGKYLHVTFSVAGEIAGPSATTPYYYLAVINLTNDLNDAGPLPIAGTTPGNGIAAPSILTGDYQTFVGFIEYRTDSGQYVCYKAPSTTVTTTSGTKMVYQHAVDVASPDGFVPIYNPDRSVLPGPGGNTFDATLDLNRLKPPDADSLPQYALVNVITYSYLAYGTAYVNGARYYDAIGSGSRTSSDLITLQTNQSGAYKSSDGVSQGGVMDQYGNTVTSAPNQVIPNLQIVSWSARIETQ